MCWGDGNGNMDEGSMVGKFSIISRYFPLLNNYPIMSKLWELSKTCIAGWNIKVVKIFLGQKLYIFYVFTERSSEWSFGCHLDLRSGQWEGRLLQKWPMRGKETCPILSSAILMVFAAFFWIFYVSADKMQRFGQTTTDKFRVFRINQ